MNDKKTVLIVDDDERVVRMLIRRLKKMDYSIHVAVNGGIGVEKAMELKPDIMLLDIQMPVMDGYTAISNLREMGYTGLVIACTASVRAKDTAKTIEMGCDNFIEKPIGKNFEETLRRLLKEHLE